MKYNTMNRRHFLQVVGGGIGATALTGRLSAQQETTQAHADPRPNILFIIADQHTHDVMSHSGCDWVQTPNMDRISRNGTRFTNAHVAYPVCVASRASIMTGRPPHQCHPDPTQYPDSLGHLMKRAGYETGYFGKWHVGNTKLRKVSDWHGFETAVETGGMDARASGAAIEFLKKGHDKPFFAVASFLNPHDCCQYARAQTRDMYQRKQEMDDTPLPEHLSAIQGKTHMRNGAVEINPPLEQCPPLPENFELCSYEAEAVATRRFPKSGRPFFVHPTETWTANDWREYRWGYARLVEKVDAEVGRLLSVLEETGQLENTVIVYTNDHGDGIGAHKWNQKMSFYEEPIRAPLIVSWKGKTPTGTADQLINTGLDLIPTFCDYAGMESPQELLGHSIRAFTSENGRPAHAPAHRYIVAEIGGSRNASLFGRMVRSERFKYIVYSQGRNREMLFDMETDPGETKNLAVDPGLVEVLGEHRRMLGEWGEVSKDLFPEAFLNGTSG